MEEALDLSFDRLLMMIMMMIMIYISMDYTVLGQTRGLLVDNEQELC